MEIGTALAFPRASHHNNVVGAAVNQPEQERQNLEDTAAACARPAADPTLLHLLAWNLHPIFFDSAAILVSSIV